MGNAEYMGQLLPTRLQNAKLLKFQHCSYKKKSIGPTEIRTRITGFRVLGANHYTMGPSISLIYFLIPMYQWIPQDPLQSFTSFTNSFSLRLSLFYKQLWPSG